MNTAVFAAQESVDQTLAVSATGRVDINVVRGDLNIVGWDKDEVHVEGELDAQTTEFVFVVEGGVTTLAVQVPRSLDSWCCDEGSDLVVKVPRGSQLNITSVSTDTHVASVLGGVDIRGVSGDLVLADIHQRVDVTTVSGDVSLRDASASRLQLKTVSGDVDVRGVEGSTTLQSVSGDLTLRDASGEVELNSVSGDIDLLTVAFGELRGSTVSGDVDVKGEMAKAGRLECDSVSGSIRVQFSGEVNARFDLETNNGSIKNRLSSDRPEESKYGDHQTLRMVIGDGSAEVMLQSRTGDILVDR